jgi:HD-GYP domain-containing protein (c-di-GMP phosphodiesterase class II)
MAATTAPAASMPEMRLSELLSALGLALDMTEGQLAGHCLRCCWIGTHIGEQIGLSEAKTWELYYVLLLKDLGCSGNAARIYELYLTDDLKLKNAVKNFDGSLPQALRFVLAQTGLKGSLAERFHALVNVVQNGGQIARELIETRCQRGAEIARKMRLPEGVAQGIQNLDEHWDGGGMPVRLRGPTIPIYSRIALLAQVIDMFHSSHGIEAARREARHRSGTWFDPQLVRAFERVADRPQFWDTLRSPNLHDAICALESAQRVKMVDEDHLDDIAAAFAKVIDWKSPYTIGRSERVTLFTDMIAAKLALSAERRRWLKRAALLHDIGKLGISNAILDKPGKLDPDEWSAVQMHVTYSETILSRIAAFKDLAPIAGAHHERLDGKGYPRGLKGDQIALETRIITTGDIFDALTAVRPYRAAMSIASALATMSEGVGTAIDPDCFNALRQAIGGLGDILAA